MPLTVFINNDIQLPLTDGETGDVKLECDIPNNLQFPVKNGQFLGNLNVYTGNNLIYCEKLYIINGKYGYDFSESFLGTIKRWSLYESK